MYLIYQELALRIAQMGKIEPKEIRDLFQAKTDEEAEILEDKILTEILAKTGSKRVAKAMAYYSPLYFAHREITSYTQKDKSPGLRALMPEVLSAEELALLAQRDLHLTIMEIEVLVGELRKLEILISKNENASKV